MERERFEAAAVFLFTPCAPNVKKHCCTTAPPLPKQHCTASCNALVSKYFSGLNWEYGMKKLHAHPNQNLTPPFQVVHFLAAFLLALGFSTLEAFFFFSLGVFFSVDAAEALLPLSTGSVSSASGCLRFPLEPSADLNLGRLLGGSFFTASGVFSDLVEGAGVLMFLSHIYIYIYTHKIDREIYIYIYDMIYMIYFETVPYIQRASRSFGTKFSRAMQKRNVDFWQKTWNGWCSYSGSHHPWCSWHREPTPPSSIHRNPSAIAEGFLTWRYLFSTKITILLSLGATLNIAKSLLREIRGQVFSLLGIQGIIVAIHSLDDGSHLVCNPDSWQTGVILIAISIGSPNCAVLKPRHSVARWMFLAIKRSCICVRKAVHLVTICGVYYSFAVPTL